MSALVTLVATAHPFAVLGYGIALGVVLTEAFHVLSGFAFRRSAKA